MSDKNSRVNKTPEFIKIIIANRVRLAMEAAETAVPAVSKAIGLTDQGLRHILNAKAVPNAATLRRLADHLNVEMGWLSPSETEIEADVIAAHLQASALFEAARKTKAGEKKALLQQGQKTLEAFEDPEEWDKPSPSSNKVPLAGYVGAGGEVIIPPDYEPYGSLDDVDVPFETPPGTVAARVKGNSNKSFLPDGTLLIWSKRRRDIPSFLGRMVVCHLADGRKLVKTLRRGSEPGLYDLESTDMGPMTDEVVEMVSPIDWIKLP